MRILLLLAFVFLFTSQHANADEYLLPIEHVDFSNEYNHIQLKNGQIIKLIGIPETAAEYLAFEAMSAEEQIRFLDRKKMVLQDLANALSTNRKLNVIGGISKTVNGTRSASKMLINPIKPTMDYIGKKTKSVFSSVINLLQKHNFLDKPSSSELDSEFADKRIFPRVIEQASPAGKINEKGIEVLSHLLELLDSQLWANAKKVANAPYYSWIGYLGISAGAGMLNKAIYKMIGVEVDIIYNFNTNERKIDFHFIHQRPYKTAFVMEAGLTYGAMTMFHDGSERTQRFNTLQLPFVFAKRFDKNTFGYGISSGTSFILLGSLYLISNGMPELGAAVLSAYKVFTGIALYTTDTTRTRFFQPPAKEEVVHTEDLEIHKLKFIQKMRKALRKSLLMDKLPINLRITPAATRLRSAITRNSSKILKKTNSNSACRSLFSK